MTENEALSDRITVLEIAEQTTQEDINGLRNLLSTQLEALRLHQGALEAIKAALLIQNKRIDGIEDALGIVQ